MPYFFPKKPRKLERNTMPKYEVNDESKRTDFAISTATNPNFMHQKYNSLNIQLASDGPSLLLPAIVIFFLSLTFVDPFLWSKKKRKNAARIVCCIKFGRVRRSVKFFEEFLDEVL